MNTKNALSRRTLLMAALTAAPAAVITLSAQPALASTSSVQLADAVSVSLRSGAAVVGTPGTYRPDETTTGWRPIRPTLTDHDGDITVTQAGTVIQGLRIRGRVLVRAADVTIKECEIVGRGYTGGNSAMVDCNHVAARRVIVEDCELHQAVATANVYHNAVIGHDYTARRNLVYDVVDGFGVYNVHGPAGPSNVVIEANYVRSLSYFSPDPNHSDNRTHNDCIQIQGNTGTRIVGNHLRGYASETVGQPRVRNPFFPYVTGNVIVCTPNVSTITGLVVESNWLHGAVSGFTAVPGSKPVGHLGQVRNNFFGSDMRLPTTPFRVQQGGLTVDAVGNRSIPSYAAVAPTFLPAGAI